MPAVAGRFYPDSPDRCRAVIQQLLESPPVQSAPPLPDRLFAAIVPHAGWVCSGSVAAHTLAALAARTPARTLFLTGSVHTPFPMLGPTLDSADAWHTPLGPIAVDTDLRDALAALPNSSTLDMAHEYEHALEVQLPILHETFGPDIRILPCMIPPHPDAHHWGRAIGNLLKNRRQPVALICSTDLTHYGPNYRFTPHGSGESGRRWAFDINDQRLLDLIQQMKGDAIVPEVHHHHNACGPGALAAVLAAAQSLGASRAYLLEHTDSTAQLAPLGRTDPDNSVGYAGIVLG
jgi:hypothetical protein